MIVKLLITLFLFLDPDFLALNFVIFTFPKDMDHSVKRRLSMMVLSHALMSHPYILHTWATEVCV